MLKRYGLVIWVGLLLSGMAGIETSWAKNQTLPGEIVVGRMAVSHLARMLQVVLDVIAALRD
ncbi:hypothetical protein, partial [Spirulina sp. 06S082]|uniref:hypothetical protein n=1 Tax=Spirulina sp. 06S082 TaxID=3110248 RepID=UPI002B20911C